MFDGRNAKLWKSLTWLYCPDLFKAMLIREIGNLEERAHNQGLISGVRLNGSSDVLWERSFPGLFTLYPDVTFYDYTKIPSRFRTRLPENYHLTFSRSEENDSQAFSLLRRGVNVAIVFTDLQRAIRDGYKGHRVINGDETDCRPIDPKGVIVGLSPKGHAKDDTGFFID